MKRLILLLALFTVVCMPAMAHAQSFRKPNGRVDHAALNRECNGVPAYSRTWGGLNSKASARITAEALGDAAESIKPFLQPGSEVSVDAKLAFVRALVGGYGADAHLVVVENYFCRLIALHPDKRTELLAARDNALDLFAEVYDPVNSGATAGDYAAFRSRIVARGGGTQRILTSAQVMEAISDFKFDTRLTADLVVKTSTETANASLCIGTSFQSIELVDMRILRSLGRLRSTLAQYVSGDGSVAVRLWLSAPRDIYTAPGGATLNLTVDKVTCLEDLSKSIKTAVQAAPPAAGGAPASAPPTTTSSPASASDPSTPSAPGTEQAPPAPITPVQPSGARASLRD